MTIERILEPELMDSNEDARAYNNMDHSSVNEVFVADLLAFLKQKTKFQRVLDPDSIEDASLLPSEEDLPIVFDVLDVGTGTALIPVELCEQSEDFRVMGIDMAVSMLELARYNCEANSFGHRIELAQIDAKSMEFDKEYFDVVMSNSIIHHIPDPLTTVEHIVRITRKEGAIFVRDLMRPESLESLDETVRAYAGEESEYCQKLFRDSLHAALSLSEMQELVGKYGFSPETVVASSDRHWTWSAFRE